MSEAISERAARLLAEHNPRAAAPDPIAIAIPTGRSSAVAVNVPPGGQPGSITSPHRGDSLDPLRRAILALQHAAELEDDDQDLAVIHKCITAIQGVLANNAKQHDAAMGITPALRAVRRVSRGAGY